MSREYGQLYPVAKAVVTPVFRFLWRITTSGNEHLPDDGPAILAPNHISVFDSFLLPAVLPRRVSFVGKAEYLDDWKTRKLFPALGMVPIDRGGGEAAQRALDTAERLLNDGELFGIYPEGTRARDGLLHKGHTGAARLAVKTGAPIIPVGILGTRAIQPPDAPMPKPFRPAEIRFGRPILARDHPGGDERLRLRQITDELMFEIRDLTGQDYANTYATKPKKVEAEAPATPVAVIEPDIPRRSSREVLAAVGA